MTTYAAIVYTHDADWTSPEVADEMAEYGAFSAAAGSAITGGAVLYPNVDRYHGACVGREGR